MRRRDFLNLSIFHALPIITQVSFIEFSTKFHVDILTSFTADHMIDVVTENPLRIKDFSTAYKVTKNSLKTRRKLTNT